MNTTTDPTVESPKTFNTPDPKNFMRNGKIAALPRAVRESLNRQLRAGHSGPEILDWLREDEATQIVLTRKFGGRQINLTNLSEWRHGGYREWEAQQLAYERIAQRNANLPGAGGTARHPLGEEMANLFAAELMSTLHTLMVIAPNPETRFHFLNRGMWLIRGWRKADCQAARQALEEETRRRKWKKEDEERCEGRRAKGEMLQSVANNEHSVEDGGKGGKGEKENGGGVNIQHPTSNIQHPTGENENAQHSTDFQPSTLNQSTRKLLRLKGH